MQLSIKQSQDLQIVMSAQLRQAIELLQYSTQELEQYIREQELVNPLIELSEPILKDHLQIPKTSSRHHDFMQHVTKCEKNVRDELFQQVRLTFYNEKDIRLLKHIIYHLDDNGYYEQPTQSAYNDLEIEKGIHLLQTIGPLGIGARNLKECLLLQTIYYRNSPVHTETVISNYLEELANQKWKQIAKELDISLSDLQSIYRFIQTLQPKLSSLFHQESVHTTIPDIMVDIVDGVITFSLNDYYLPKVNIHVDYVPYIQTHCSEKSFFKKHLTDYHWLVNSIEQRRNTIINLMKALIEKQNKFFLYGFDAIQPLTLREIADQIDVHESTVSRITTNKYVQTAFGTFELRELFTSKLSTANGHSVSQIKVKSLLADYIKSENKTKPFSDQKIAEYFNAALGIEISRRTIAKYREDMNIPSSARRKVIQFK
ncbi:RNA polymerase factor sigma-54 [Lysinibacillus cavernae]|uniref:RNA polymerase factor sigma-54 n=1 Tax=Lysinibacillus cavernae TaxID=2666135 RepID=UPI0012D9322B|nr:RNA polymerase factor sigma-54 [Lysinibacillus cavernae]